MSPSSAQRLQYSYAKLAMAGMLRARTELRKAGFSTLLSLACASPVSTVTDQGPSKALVLFGQSAASHNTPLTDHIISPTCQIETLWPVRCITGHADDHITSPTCQNSNPSICTTLLVQHFQPARCNVLHIKHVITDISSCRIPISNGET